MNHLHEARLRRYDRCPWTPARAVNTVCTWPVVYGPFTRPWPRRTWPRQCMDRIHRRARTVYMVRPWPEHSRVTAGTWWSCTLACLRPVYTAVHGVYRPGRRPYMIRRWPCTRPCPCTRSSLRPVHGRVNVLWTYWRSVNVLVTRPCTGHVTCTRACLHFRPITWHFLRVVYTAVYLPCTRPCTGRVHGRPWTAVFMVRTRGHGRVHFP